MTKELSEVLKKMRKALLYSSGVSLNHKELRLILKYIRELEIEISGGNEED